MGGEYFVLGRCFEGSSGAPRCLPRIISPRVMSFWSRSQPRGSEVHLSSFLKNILLMLLATGAIVLPRVQAFAQDPPNKERPRRVLPTATEPQGVIKIDPDLVPIDVTDTDVRGRLRLNRKSEAFNL